MTAMANPREQHFYLSIAKHAFYHADKGIVFVGDPIRLSEAEDLGLTPLLLYGITVPGTRITWQTFTLLTEPRSIAGVLLEGWTTAPGLRGYPDVLKINRHVAKACPSLQNSLTGIGDMSLVVADGADKQFFASLAAAQYRSLSLGKRILNDDAINNVQELNAQALNAHNMYLNYRLWDMNSPSLKQRTSAWLSLTINTCNEGLKFTALDWEGGYWLCSWEAAVPSDQLVYFWRSGADPAKNGDGKTKPGCYWLIHDENGLDEYDDEYYEDAGLVSDDEWRYFYPRNVKILLDCWPGKSSQIAHAIGITGKQLLWFLSDKAALSGAQRRNLSTLLGIDISVRYEGYDVRGACVLIAENPKKCAVAYCQLSNGGGDVDYSVEVIPEIGVPDPSWRYVVFGACDRLPCIFMVSRGSKTSEQLTKKLLANFQGEKRVSPTVYRDVVSTCATCCAEPVMNRLHMIEFGERRYEYFCREWPDLS